MKFLLVEDDEALAGAIEQLLGQHHYVMDLATDGVMGKEMAEAFPYDLILLDWSLPKLDGVELCKHLRNEGDRTPIILLTARNDSTDKVDGLDAGADDYLVKPFGFDELLARIRAVLRRAEGITLPVLKWGDLQLDPRSSEVTCRNTPIAVTPKEYALLELFLRNPNRIFSLDNLLDRVWSFEDSPSVGSVRTHIKGLRQKLKKAGLPEMVTTVYGLGYRLKSAEAANRLVSKDKSEAKNEATSENRLDLSSLWQSVSQGYSQRLIDFSQDISELHPGPISKAKQQQLLTEAHALAGSLGSFGFHLATELCRELENLLHQHEQLSAQHIEQMGALIRQVQQTLERGLAPDPSLVQSTQDLLIETVSSDTLAPPKVTALAPSQLYQMLIVAASDSRDEKWMQTLTASATYYQMQVSAVDNAAEARQKIFGEEASARFPSPTPSPNPLPDLVVLNLNGLAALPENNSSELDLLASLQAVKPPIPTLLLMAAASFENRVKAARMGVTRLLQAPVTPAEVLEAATQVLRKGAPATAKLLIVDDDPAMLTLLKSLLQPWGFQLQTLSDPLRFWQVLEGFEPDLVLLDAKMPQINGLELCQVLRNAPRWHDLPVLFMSAYTDAEMIQQVFLAGADDYVRKPIVASELVARVLGWLERSRDRQLRADIDNLTGIANRRKSTQMLTRLLGLAQRQQQSLCFALLDLDHFKQINDEYGHPAGDRVLRRFGESLKAMFRNEDVVGRWGGEEFVIGLYGMTRQEGTQRLRQFLQNWQQEQFNRFGSRLNSRLDSLSEGDRPTAAESLTPLQNSSFSITFTAGVAVYPHDGTDLQQLYCVADKDLYRAKATGRNQVSSVK
ncbi:MAG: response regulator [Phormidesmis sp.]